MLSKKKASRKQVIESGNEYNSEEERNSAQLSSRKKVLAKEEQLAAAGLQDPINPTTGRVIRFNTCRYLNVMFGSVMKPKLANRGGRLTRRELEDKLRTDQNFAVSFLVEYNKRDEEAYGRLA